MTPADFPRRYAPEIPFPAYAYVSGKHPHPVTHPDGHCFGRAAEESPIPDSADLRGIPQFRHGVDLFNHGYYWEAHEVWEAFWHACGRQGQLADFLKGLIRLAAAGVKGREGNRNGVIRHAKRAQELFRQAGHAPLREISERLVENPMTDANFTIGGNPVLGIQLVLDDLVVGSSPVTRP